MSKISYKSVLEEVKKQLTWELEETKKDVSEFWKAHDKESYMFNKGVAFALEDALKTIEIKLNNEKERIMEERARKAKETIIVSPNGLEKPGYKIDIVEDGCAACPYWVSDKYGNHACYKNEYLRCKDGRDDYGEG